MKFPRLLVLWECNDQKTCLSTQLPIGNEKKFTQPAITCSKLIAETLEHGVKYVQS